MEARRFERKFIPKNSGEKYKPQGIVLHETADPGATADKEYKFFSTHLETNAHAFIDWTKDLQIVPWDIKCWHAKSPANDRFIGVEMCRPATHNPEKFRVVYWAAVNAFARLYRWVLNIKVVTKDNCMSHDEVRIRWRKTNHTDPTALFKEYGKTMDQFRADVQYQLDGLWKE